MLKLVAALACVLAAAAPAHGQETSIAPAPQGPIESVQRRSVAAGLRLNVHASAARLDGSTGLRPGASASYGNGALLSVYASFDRAPITHDGFDADLEHLDAGVRVQLRSGDARLIPFVFGGATWRSVDYGERPLLGEVQDVRVHGLGYTIGTGVAWYIVRRLAVEGALLRSAGGLDRVRVDGLDIEHEEAAIGDASWRAEIGLSWWIPR